MGDAKLRSRGFWRGFLMGTRSTDLSVMRRKKSVIRLPKRDCAKCHGFGFHWITTPEGTGTADCPCLSR